MILEGDEIPRDGQCFGQRVVHSGLPTDHEQAAALPPANKTAVLPPDMAAMAISEKQLENTVRLDWVTINAGRGENLEKWNKQVLGG